MTTCTAFNGTTQIASGTLAEVAVKVREARQTDAGAQVLVFDDATGDLVEVNSRRTDAAPLPAAPPAAESDVTKRPGRPKLGVVPREVTLLPRHWDWLGSQPGGASVALRKLVEHAIKSNQERDRVRRAQEATYRFVSAMAGNEPHFEDAIRALFASQQEAFENAMKKWPADICRYARTLATAVFIPMPTGETSK